MRTLIAALGNEIRGDDGLPFAIIDKIKQKIKTVDYMKISESGFNLIDLFLDYKKVILIDTVKLSEFDTGEIVLCNLNDIDYFQMFSAHGIGIISALQICKFLKLNFPDNIKIVLINVRENNRFKIGFSLKPEKILKRILKILYDII